MGVESIGDVHAVLSPGSEHFIVERAGHFLHLEQPDAVRAHVLEFLDA
jgi:pimeloyl-ACP methyl ester carboxylesterase